MFNFIKIGGAEIYRPKDLTLKKEADIQAQYTTCTGMICGDIVGVRYADDLNLEWDVLTDAMLIHVSNLVGKETTIEFLNENGEKISEKILVKSVGGKPTRSINPAGNPVWTGITAEIQFIGRSK